MTFPPAQGHAGTTARMVPALVLTAGLATRLRPLSFVRAKAALPIGDLTIAQRILRSLAAFGVTDAVLNLHHLPHTITALIGDGSAEGVRVRYSWESPVLGSAGGPRRALPLLASPRFLIVNGDTLTDVNVRALVEAHARSGALVTLAVIPNVEPQKYGGLLVEDGIVRGFVKRNADTASFHFIGVQVVEAEVFAGLPDGVPTESVGQVYPALMSSRPGSVRAFVTNAEFHDIGTPMDYLATCLHFELRESPPTPLGASGIPNPGSRIPDPGSRPGLRECVLWDDVEVHPAAQLRRCIVTDGVRIPAGASWENATIRVAHGELMERERLVGELAIGPLDGSTGA
jgi:NDP-sugar pyrophosphorylase family protein